MAGLSVSVLFNEPKLLKFKAAIAVRSAAAVSVLFNEPKLLKLVDHDAARHIKLTFQCSSTSRNC